MTTHSSLTEKELYRTLITANHIIHDQQVVDAYGHVSARHPQNAEIFIMSGSVAPGTVSQPSDLIQYWVRDSSPVDPEAKLGYQERFIHSELYKKFPEINSVVHSHSESVLPFATGVVEMRPCFHIAGFLGTHVPSYDILEFYPDGALQDQLVNTEHLGSTLASKFASSSSSSSSSSSGKPDHAVVLMQSHGFTTVGKDIPQAVFRAVYTHKNAGVQYKSIVMGGAVRSYGGKAGGGGADGGKVKYLSEEQVVGCKIMGENTQGRPWGLWVRETEANPFYVNKG